MIKKICFDMHVEKTLEQSLVISQVCKKTYNLYSELFSTNDDFGFFSLTSRMEKGYNLSNCLAIVKNIYTFLKVNKQVKP